MKNDHFYYRSYLSIVESREKLCAMILSEGFVKNTSLILFAVSCVMSHLRFMKISLALNETFANACVYTGMQFFQGGCNVINQEKVDFGNEAQKK